MKPSGSIIIRKHRKAAERGSRLILFLKGFGLTSLALFLIIITGAGLAFAVFSQSLPSLEPFHSYYENKPGPTRFYARDGETLLFTLAYKDFTSGDLAVCETDGEGCFPHTFLEASRITRRKNNRGEAGTITEEMVRNIYAKSIENSRWPDLTIRLLSRQVLQTYGEKQITEWYYNNAWFGQMAFGLDAAARLYLDKSGDSLNDAECVLMSAVINAPMLNPIDSKGALRDFYLNQLAVLHQAGLFTDEETESLSHSNFIIFEPPRYADEAEPDIITGKALDAAMLIYGREQVERGGMKIVTSEDFSLQTYLNCVTSTDNEAENTACPLSSDYSDEERRTAAEALRTAPASIAILDVKTGQILAELEAQADNDNRRYYGSSLQSYPIGNSINYFAALTAFSGGSSPSTLLWDLKNVYSNSNTENGTETEPYHGPVMLREALTGDYQRPLAAHLQRFGSGAVQRNAALFGLSDSHLLTDDEVLRLGGNYSAETMAFALIPFANSGYQSGSSSGGAIRPVSILRVDWENGGEEIPQPQIQKSLIADNLAYLVHNVFTRSSGSFSLPDRPSAVKIGTAEGEKGMWISGYTTELSAAMRLAESNIISAFVTDDKLMENTAEILWHSLMETAHRDRPVSGWNVPDGISQVRICLPSGKLPTASCRETMTDVFLQGNEPYEYDDYYVTVPINRENRMLATRHTPPENVINEIFLNLPSEADEWAAENGIEQVPTAYDPIRDETRSGAIQIESPTAFQPFDRNSKVDIIVRLSLKEQPETMQVSIGAGMYPAQWQEVCSGGSLENGQWLLCSLNTKSFEPGLYVLRTAFTLPDQKYREAETYFEIE